MLVGNRHTWTLGDGINNSGASDHHKSAYRTHYGGSSLAAGPDCGFLDYVQAFPFWEGHGVGKGWSCGNMMGPRFGPMKHTVVEVG